MSGSTIERALAVQDAAAGPPPAADRAGYAEAIRSSWRRSTEAILETGRRLTAAKAALDHGEFGAMIEADLPFSHSTANKLMALAEAADGDADSGGGWLNSESIPNLPNGWAPLYELTLLDPETRAAALADGTIHPDMTLNDTKTLRRMVARRVRLDLAEAKASHATPLPAKIPAGEKGPARHATFGTARRYAVIYADPPWLQETRSDKGRAKSADNHYPVMSLDEIRALPVAEIAADDAVLLLWTFSTHIPHALAVLEAWGFDYVTKCRWLKTNADGSPHVGTGFWFRDTGEDLILARRGKGLPAPMPGTQQNSDIPAPAARHSEKPAAFRDMIDAYFPGVRKIELFARSPADGWDAWGNEVGLVAGSDAGGNGGAA